MVDQSPQNRYVIFNKKENNHFYILQSNFVIPTVGMFVELAKESRYVTCSSHVQKLANSRASGSTNPITKEKPRMALTFTAHSGRITSTYYAHAEAA
jgi:hypothetical protein